MDELTSIIEQAKKAEESESFFSASIYYKDALEIAKKNQNSKLIKLYKSKFVEMNKKSIESGKDYKEVEFTVNFNEEQQKVIKSVIEKIIVSDNIETILKIIGQHPYLYLHVKETDKLAKKTIPLSLQFCSLSTISDNGHSLKGGSDPDYSWFMDTYSRNQKLIMDMYLNQIFYLLITNKKMTIKTLSKYFVDSKLFKEDQLKLILIGLQKYFEKDYVSAMHILVPQFESFLLKIASQLGIDIVALDNAKAVTTRTLTLSEHHLESKEFKDIFGEDFCMQIKFILFDSLGYKIRHKIAHGEIQFNECNFQNTTLILYLYLVILGRVDIKEKTK